MPQYIDLHLHSTSSDGSYAPAEVMRMAKAIGLSAVALADHDNVDGIDAAMLEGSALGLDVLTAVELSTLWGEYKDIHLLGYGFNHHDQGLQQALAGFRDFRERRNELIVERVNEKLKDEGRTPLDLAAVKEKAGGTIGRPHIAMALLDAGHVANKEEAFERYLVPCNVEKRFFPIEDAIAMIHRAGGAAVLAHPPYITQDRRSLELMVKAFTTMGLDGIEAYNNGADNDNIDWTISLARRNNLVVTGGSDFHGADGEVLTLGGHRGNLKVPAKYLDEINAVIYRRQQEI